MSSHEQLPQASDAVRKLLTETAVDKYSAADIVRMSPEQRSKVQGELAAVMVRMGRIANRPVPQEQVELAERYWQEYPEQRPSAF